MNVFFKFQFIVGLLLFACLNVQADDDLITRQITVKLDKAGTLPDKIGSARKYLITNLKIVGELNGTDFGLIRDMSGSDIWGRRTDGKLATLDLSEVKVVGGGDPYFVSDNTNYRVYYTRNDKIGDYAFYLCSNLVNVTLPSSVTSIDMCAFDGCSGLTSITLPSSVTSIGLYAFSRCSGLTNITLPSGVTSIGGSAFSRCSGLTNITLPSSVTSIGGSAFSGCSSLTTITIPSSVTSIGGSAFWGCSSLTSIAIPDSVTLIGESAFSGCCNLTSIAIPDSVTSIGAYAFSGCSSLTSIAIPDSVISIGESAFGSCKSLQSVYVSWDTPLVIPASTFESVDTKTCILYVPKGTHDDYWLTNWGIFDNIVEYDVTGIDKVTTSDEVKEVSRYSVNGQRLDTPTRGLNIVKYSDGSVKKVVVQ